jgi:hypothetical protein
VLRPSGAIAIEIAEKMIDGVVETMIDGVVETIDIEMIATGTEITAIRQPASRATATA